MFIVCRPGALFKYFSAFSRDFRINIVLRGCIEGSDIVAITLQWMNDKERVVQMTSMPQTNLILSGRPQTMHLFNLIPLNYSDMH